MKAQKTPLKEARVVFYGAGSSAVGVAEMIARLIELDAKVSAETARKVGRPAPYANMECAARRVHCELPGLLAVLHELSAQLSSTLGYLQVSPRAAFRPCAARRPHTCRRLTALVGPLPESAAARRPSSWWTPRA